MVDVVNVRIHKPIHAKYKKEAIKQGKRSTQSLINQVLAEKKF